MPGTRKVRWSEAVLQHDRIGFLLAQKAGDKIGDAAGNQAEYDLVDVEWRNLDLIEEDEYRKAYNDGYNAALAIALLPVQSADQRPEEGSLQSAHSEQIDPHDDVGRGQGDKEYHNAENGGQQEAEQGNLFALRLLLFGDGSAPILRNVSQVQVL